MSEKDFGILHLKRISDYVDDTNKQSNRINSESTQSGGNGQQFGREMQKRNVKHEFSKETEIEEGKNAESKRLNESGKGQKESITKK